MTDYKAVLSDDMVTVGAEVLHDSLRSAGCDFDFDSTLNGTEIQQGIVDAVYRAMLAASHDTGMVAVPRELLERIIAVHDTGFDPDGVIMELEQFMEQSNG